MLADVIKDFESLFSTMNSRFYNNELPMPVISTHPRGNIKAMGWCTRGQIWRENEKGYYEINICAEFLDLPYEETAHILLLEMAHLYANEHNIKDCTRGGTYHNKKYKEIAEAHGLTCLKSSKYGYSTMLTRETAEWIAREKGRRQSIKRMETMKKEKKKSSSRKYICPECGTIVRATKDVYVICGDCGVTMEKEE